MQTILIANPKGGSGKTTLATNVAGWLAGKRQRVLLDDRDPQQSSAFWLSRRPKLFPAIAGAGEGGKRARDDDHAWRVVDSPAGLSGEALKKALKGADIVLVPVTPSFFDMAATARFLTEVREAMGGSSEGPPAVGLVAMRVDSRTHSAADLDTFMKSTGYPVVAQLRVTQVYVHCAKDGASIFDLPRSRAEQDQEQWRPLTRWIARHAPARGESR